jgi:superfamily II DNA or RNA helicase
MRIRLPPVYALDTRFLTNPVRQVAVAAVDLEGSVARYSGDRVSGRLLSFNGSPEVLVVDERPGRAPAVERILLARVASSSGEMDLRKGTWLRHPAARQPSSFDFPREIALVERSWEGAFAYVQEDPPRSVVGLRGPQIGAVHAVHAHWSAGDEPATIVMPTGTGKTETMLSVMVSVPCHKVLVVVPTDALRTQIADKFETLGVLKSPSCNVLRQEARYPLVGTLLHRPRTPQEVEDYFGKCQVVVATSSIVGGCDRVVQARMAQVCTHLFIDEAHHAEAPTWRSFREQFADRRVLQFTATPFRDDGAPLDGKIIYKYSLRRAQQESYFKPIRFHPVAEFDRRRADAAIAAKAIEKLEADHDRGHILMARVDSIQRAGEVFELYKRYSQYRPVQIHTRVKPAERERAREAILSRRSRIVVCVDMLGEGFDLPELKIAAFHDIRKSLAITLQLAGRFTRTRPDLGDASFIANVADVNVGEELRKLYSRDPDWNLLLPDLAERLIGEQVSLQEFLRGFTEFPSEIPLRAVRAASSAVAFKTDGRAWQPNQFARGIPGLSACEQVYPTINEEKHTLVVVTARRVPLQWAEVENVFDWEWELFVIVWLPDLRLLFVNGSTNADYRSLAEAIGGETVEPIRGQEVFRAFAGVNRLRFQNVGLTEQLGRNVRYTGRMGTAVDLAMTDVQRRHGIKSVMAGTGYENGSKVTVGASRKGRIWSVRRTHIDGLVEWCRVTGAKLIDERIDPDQVLAGTLHVDRVSTRPAGYPIAVDWPEIVYRSVESAWSIQMGDVELSLTDVSIELVEPSIDGDVVIAIASEFDRTRVRLELFEQGESPQYRFVQDGPRTTTIKRGGGRPEPLTDFFDEEPPVVWFADGASLEGNEYVRLRHQAPPFDRNKIETWDWAGTDLTTESQGLEKNPASVQARVIRELIRRAQYRVVFDDDGKGELADVVAVRVIGDLRDPKGLHLDLFHCKYSGAPAPGARVKDLYEVCGQAQKCISWMASPERQKDMLMHLLRRDADRTSKGDASRFELGDAELLRPIREMSEFVPLTVRVSIVQPGLSRASATREQLELLSVTENHLMETYQLPFVPIGSP